MGSTLFDILPYLILSMIGVAFKFDRYLNFAPPRKMLTPPIARLPTI